MIIKIFFIFIGLSFIAVAIIIRYFPQLLGKIIQKLFKKMSGIDTNNQSKKQKDITFEKKGKKKDQGYSDYEIIDDEPSDGSPE
jgi:hypothetical protein